MNIIQRSIIKVLNNTGVKVLEIYDPHNRQETLSFYATDEFTPSQNNIPEHSIIGYDITRIIQEDSLQVQTANNSDIHSHKIMTKMAELETVNLKFSKDFSFIWYIK
jgi:hypothetical protein